MVFATVITFRSLLLRFYFSGGPLPSRDYRNRFAPALGPQGKKENLDEKEREPPKLRCWR